MPTPLRNFTHISLEVETNLEAWEDIVEPKRGSRPKLILKRSSDGAYFIFKRPKNQREHQIWSELLGSFIAGDLFGWEVQHTALGIRHGSPGNLLRYIYGAGSEEQFIEGWELCKEIDPEFDVDKGQHHTFPLLLRTYEEVISSRYNISRTDFMEFWSRALALDTLISNTDRHAENWAIIESPSGNRMAAFYDNGSSMGCGLDTVGLDRCFNEDGQIKPTWLARFRDSGRHHVRLDQPAKQGAIFKPLCHRLLDEYPEGRAAFEHAAGIDLETIRLLTREIISHVRLPESYALTERRAAHIQAVLQIGLERIRNILRERRT